nr:hypothetical protein [Tanacetum cinerariifolium]
GVAVFKVGGGSEAEAAELDYQQPPAAEP